MDKLNYYRQIIKQVLREYHQWAANANQEDVEQCLIFDEVQDHYLWLSIGWHGKQRIQNIIVYLHIKSGKIWVDSDETKQGSVNELLTAGIPHQDIVLGFQHPSKRHFTEFAVR